MALDPERLAASISAGIVRALGDSYTMAPCEILSLELVPGVSNSLFKRPVSVHQKPQSRFGCC
jgi:hypothetical protein